MDVDGTLTDGKSIWQCMEPEPIKAEGGDGAVREFIEWVTEEKGN